MSKKQLNVSGMMNELRGQSLFFAPQPESEAAPTPPPTIQEIKNPPSMIELTTKQEDQLQTHRVTESVTPRDTDSVSDRLTELDRYDVPDFRLLARLELRLTWDQKRYLDELEALIARDMPEGERSNPDYKRITKNSVVRVLVEIARRSSLTVDASRFKNEADLLKAILSALTDRLTELQSHRLPEKQTP